MSRSYYKGSGFDSHTSMTTTTEASSSNRIFFFTEYHFSSLGVAEIKLAFDKKLRDRELDAQHEWIESSQAFKVKCFPTDARAVASLFRVALADFIKSETTPVEVEDETDDEEEDIEEIFIPEKRLSSSKIQRLAIWKNDLLEKNRSLATKLNLQEPTGSNVLPLSNHDPMFDDMKFRDTWACTEDKEHLDFIVPDSILPDLTRLTGCRLIKDAIDGNVHVAGLLKEHCDLALLKLDNLRKYFFLRGCYTNHILYSEGDENVQYVLTYFRHDNKKLFKSTILDNLHVHINKGISDYENLFEAVKVRCAPYNHKKSLLIPQVENSMVKPTDNQQTGLKAWVGFVYSSRGDSDKCPVSINFSQPPTNAPQIVSIERGNHWMQRNKRQPERNANILLWANEIPQINTPSDQIPVSSSFANQQISGIQLGQKQIHGDVPSEHPVWDTYSDWNDNELGQRKQSGGGAQISIGLASNLTAMKQSVSISQSSSSQFSRSKRHQQMATALRSSQGDDTQAIARVSQPVSLQQFAMVSQLNLLEADEAQLPPHRCSEITLRLLQAPLIPQNSMPPSFSNVLLAPVGSTSSNSPSVKHRSRENSTKRVLEPQAAKPSGVMRASVTPVTVPPSTEERVRSNLNTNHSDFIHPIAPFTIKYQNAATYSVNDHCLLDDDNLEAVNLAILQPQNLSKDFLQINEEVSTRAFQKTMSQLAGKPKKTSTFAARLPVPEWPAALSKPEMAQIDLEDPLPGFIADIDQAFNEMITALRGFRGEIVVQVDFGRIILRYFHQKQLSVKAGGKVIPHDAAMIRSMLLNPTVLGPTSHFTKVLTTMVGDVSNILRMKDKSGAALWEETVTNWSVLYEFTFKDIIRNTYFTVEVDGESFVTKVKTTQELGRILVHGTKRYNDFQISATGHENSDANERYSYLANALERSLWIPAKKQQPEIYWVLEHVLLQQFILEELAVRRVCRFKSKDMNSHSVLNISDLQALDIKGAWIAGNKACVFYGTPGPENTRPYKKLNAWQEVFITSSQVTKILDLNKKLDIGEEAAWTVESMAGAAWDICLPACQMVKKMNGFGWDDQNGVPTQETIKKSILAREGETPGQKKTDEDSFW